MIIMKLSFNYPYYFKLKSLYFIFLYYFEWQKKANKKNSIQLLSVILIEKSLFCFYLLFRMVKQRLSLNFHSTISSGFNFKAFILSYFIISNGKIMISIKLLFNNPYLFKLKGFIF